MNSRPRRGGYRIRPARGRNLFESGHKIRVRVRVGRKLRNLGYFDCESDAMSARDEYLKLIYGCDFKRLVEKNQNFGLIDLPGLDVYYDHDTGDWIYAPDRGRERKFGTKFEAIDHAERQIRKREGMFAYVILGSN